jgi:hypothetical protein
MGASSRQIAKANPMNVFSFELSISNPVRVQDGKKLMGISIYSTFWDLLL